MDYILPIVCLLAGLVPSLILFSLRKKGDTVSQRHTDEMRRLHGHVKGWLLTRAQQEQIAALKEEFQQERRQMQERATRQEEDIRRENVAQFKALAAEILTAQTAGLKQTNSEQLKAILTRCPRI